MGARGGRKRPQDATGAEARPCVTGGALPHEVAASEALERGLAASLSERILEESRHADELGGRRLELGELGELTLERAASALSAARGVWDDPVGRAVLAAATALRWAERLALEEAKP